MPEPERLAHIVGGLVSYKVPYTTPQSRGSRFSFPQRDRLSHSRHLLQILEQIQERARQLTRDRTYAGLGVDIGLVLEFSSTPGFNLKLDSLEKRRSGIRLLNVRTRTILISDQELIVELATVLVPFGKLNVLINEIRAYQQKLTLKGRPKNEAFVGSIESIQEAAFEAFWTGTRDIPEASKKVWWELWFRRGESSIERLRIERTVELESERRQIVLYPKKIELPENVIRMAFADRTQIESSLDILNCLTEVRLASTPASFFTNLRPAQQDEWVQEAIQRLKAPLGTAPAVCLLDTGVNRGHPLLGLALNPADAHSYDPAWGANDSHIGGHGTQIAGIALYGDLTALLGSAFEWPLSHRLESVKILPPPPQQNDPQLFGRVTEESVARVEASTPRRKRVFAMQITSRDDAGGGRPSSWSSAVDSIVVAASDPGAEPRLFCVSAGNVDVVDIASYPSQNELTSIADPGQAWNAITVGAFTEKVCIAEDLPQWIPAAQAGDLAPRSSTSLIWEPFWPIKPDVVAEGGNAVVNPEGGSLDFIDSLSLLTTNANFNSRLLTTVGDTSAATGIVASIAAQVVDRYPDFWPETVRGLLVHSAEWAPRMLDFRRNRRPSKEQIELTLRKFGFGVPSLGRAILSTRASVTLIAQETMQPFRDDSGDIKTNQMVFHALPWPKRLLEENGENDAELHITLSYFIEPNPGPRMTGNRYRYASHGLRFALKRSTESQRAFGTRLNQALRDGEKFPSESDSNEWLLGTNLRHHGSIHSDLWRGTAAELAARDSIAVFPVSGWWRTRKFLNRYASQARYSLIITIRVSTPSIDLYTPILNSIQISVEVPIQ